TVTDYGLNTTVTGYSGGFGGTSQVKGGTFTVSNANTTIGVEIDAQNTSAIGINYGLKSKASSDNATNYAVYAHGYSASSGQFANTVYGIYAWAEGGKTPSPVGAAIGSYAGYFRGGNAASGST